MPKVIALEQCVREVIRPGIALHFSFTHNRPMAFAWEIVRQFRGEHLNLHLVGTGFLEYALLLVWAGHVKKLEGAFFGETYPRPKPNRLVMELAKKGELELEYWTNLTIPQRLMAQAYGWPFIPTRSLQNCFMLEEHLASGKAFYAVDPVSGNKQLMIRALEPDVTVVHGCVADEDGNTVITPPYGEDLWGVFAAKKVVVTVEKIVDSKTIRSLSHLVRIPAHRVNYVCEVPFGAHPYGVSPVGFDEYAYNEDYLFRKEFNNAAQSGGSLDDWMERWQLNRSHYSFLDYLGRDRLRRLKEAAGPGAGPGAALSCEGEGEAVKEHGPVPLPVENLIVAASRKIAEKVVAQGIELILAGIGLSHLTAWLVYKRLKMEGYSVQLLTETGYYGYDPVEGDPYIFNFGNLYTNRMHSDFTEILGRFMGDPNHRSMAILSAAQIDETGNMNSTKIPGKSLFLTGSGGANDVASVASDVVVMMEGGPQKFVRRVPYVTSGGDKVSCIFTNVAILERGDGTQPFRVTAWMPESNPSSETNYRRSLAELIPWDVPVAPDAVICAAPSPMELQWLRSHDPRGEFLN